MAFGRIPTTNCPDSLRKRGNNERRQEQGCWPNYIDRLCMKELTMKDRKAWGNLKRAWNEFNLYDIFCIILGNFDELNLTFPAKTVKRISSRRTLAVKTDMRPTWGKSLRNQTERTVKNGSNNGIREMVLLVCTVSKDLIKKFSKTWSIWALFKVTVQSKQLGHRWD